MGRVSTRPDRSKCVYRVTKIEDLINVIIPHFEAYPLLTKKKGDFLLWYKVVQLMSKKQHLTPSGFSKILSYYASINKGASLIISKAFPCIIGAERPIIDIPETLNPDWVSGFIAGDGGFFIGIRPETNQIYFRFHITQHSRDSELMNLFVTFFGCGKINLRTNKDRCDFYVQDFMKIYENIIPHFDKHPLYNIKYLDLLSFKKAADLFKLNRKQNIESIREIISNMNTKRVNE